MAIINRIAFLILSIASFIVLILLAIISPRWYVVYQMYLAELVTKDLWVKGSKDE